jgi:ATG1-like, MIT domain 2
VGEDLPGCESSYETSIIMLEALLEPTPSGDSPDSEPDRLDEEDRLTIEKCIPFVGVVNSSHPKYPQTSRYTSQETRYCVPEKLPYTLA